MTGYKYFDDLLHAYHGIFRSEANQEGQNVIEIFTVLNGKKHGLCATAKGNDAPNYFLLYNQGELIESAKSPQDLMARWVDSL